MPIFPLHYALNVLTCNCIPSINSSIHNIKQFSFSLFGLVVLRKETLHAESWGRLSMDVCLQHKSYAHRV